MPRKPVRDKANGGDGAAARRSVDDAVWSACDISDYPELTEDDIRAALAYAADRERRVTTAK